MNVRYGRIAKHMCKANAGYVRIIVYIGQKTKESYARDKYKSERKGS
ncbi:MULTISPECIES: hypothetical protein [Thermoanaerobacterium]|nr:MULTISPECIES: hypothetical protein [Thermoanaerobacterium]